MLPASRAASVGGAAGAVRSPVLGARPAVGGRAVASSGEYSSIPQLDGGAHGGYGAIPTAPDAVDTSNYGAIPVGDGKGDYGSVPVGVGGPATTSADYGQRRVCGVAVRRR